MLAFLYCDATVAIMQSENLNGVMADPRQQNISMPPELRRVVEPLLARYGTKSKWAIYGAGLLCFVKLNESERDRLLGEVLGARRIPGRLDRMIEEWSDAPVVAAPPIPPKAKTKLPPRQRIRVQQK